MQKEPRRIVGVTFSHGARARGKYWVQAAVIALVPSNLVAWLVQWTGCWTGWTLLAAALSGSAGAAFVFKPREDDIRWCKRTEERE